MRATVLLVASVVAALATGCATRLDVSFPEEEDFTQHRTWDWLPRNRNVDAMPDEEPGLEALTTRLLERKLRRLGLRRVAADADLLVGYDLRVHRRILVLNQTNAMELLASHHASPSYLVQSSQPVQEIHDHGYLRVVLVDGARERVVWRGELWARRRGGIARHLPEIVSRLMAELPVEPSPGADPRTGGVGR